MWQKWFSLQHQTHLGRKTRRGQRGRCASREAECRPTVTNRPSSGLSANSTIPDTTKLCNCLKQGGLVPSAFHCSPQPIVSPRPCSGLPRMLAADTCQKSAKGRLDMMDSRKENVCHAHYHLLLVVESEGSRESLAAQAAHEDSPAKDRECPNLLSNSMVQGHLQNQWMQMMCLYMKEKQPLKQSEAQQTLLPDCSN